MKIMIVDDVEVNRILLEDILNDCQYDSCLCGDGQEAVNYYKQHNDIDLVLMDINMPIMDGYECTKQLKQLCGDKYLPIIFVTALDDDETLAKCLEVGGEDFIAKPINEIVLEAKLKAHGRTVAYSRQLHSMNNDLLFHRRLMDREHSVVEHVLNNGLTRLDVNCDNISSYLSPMSMFNGDIVLIAPSVTDGIYALIGDFTGHGLSAAIGCLPVSDIFYAMTKKQVSVGSIAREINNSLHKLLPSNMFFCATIIEMDALGDRFTYWAGGMNDAYLLLDDTVIETLESYHMPLGILDEHEFSDFSPVCKPPKGSKLYLYTDGIVEARNAEGDFFGENRLHDLLTQSADDKIAELSKAVEMFRGDYEQDDDISLLEISCSPVAYFVKDSGSKTRADDHWKQHALPWQVSLQLGPDNFRDQDIITHLLQVVINIHGISRHKDLIYTLLSELYSNALEHGVLRLDSNIKSSVDGFALYYKQRSEKLAELTTGCIDFALGVVPPEDHSPTRLMMRFTDSGAGFDYERKIREQDDASYGRGISLAESLCDTLEYSNGGRTVTVMYSLD